MSSGPSSSSSAKGLHTIYAALDNHQYGRAIKLCLAQPASNVLAKALLAHAYSKSNQRYQALSAIYKNLFQTVELEHEIQYASVALFEQQQTQTPSAAPAAASQSKKGGGKKSKKKGGGAHAATAKPAPKTQQPTNTLSSSGNNTWDLIEQLDEPRKYREDWEQKVRSYIDMEAAAENGPTILATLAVTLTHLKLPLSAYQLYCWAAASKPKTKQQILDTSLYTRGAYLHGLSVLMAPQYNARVVVSNLLSNLQVLALQGARATPGAGAASSTTNKTATFLWPAQTALWQIRLADRNDDSMKDSKDAQRLAMLPRLAESLASKCVDQIRDEAAALENNKTSSYLLQTESFLLYLRTLDVEEKWAEKLAALEQEEHLVQQKQAILEMKMETLQKLGKDRNLEIQSQAKELLLLYPDDWGYWRYHMEASYGLDDTYEATQALVASVLETTTSKYPLRGPHLMRVEIASRTSPHELLGCVRQYGCEFATRASCAFTDLRPYLIQFLKESDDTQVRALLEWAQELRTEPVSHELKERRSELRQYIFAVQVIFLILSQFPRLSDLPPWFDLVKVWHSFQSLENAAKIDQAQKESRPPDELMLLAVQILLHDNAGTIEQIISACLLEAAILHSPYNAYLKIAAMLLYGDLRATSRSFELYNELYIKHIQNESCSYLILPILRAGGFYREIITVCQGIIGQQRSSCQESSDYARKAMENGTISKADEFLVFQRERMNKSLATLEAKGLILDAAPFFSHDNEGELGSTQGIVGASTDLERAKQMIAEAHNPTGAFSLLQLQGSASENVAKFSDNRDLDIMSFEILLRREVDSSEKILTESLRRGRIHSILIRAVLSVEGAKGPKKGKVAMPSLELGKRCLSLLKAADNVSALIEDELQPVGYKNFLLSMVEMCRAVVALSAGMSVSGEYSFDTIEKREAAVVSALKNAIDLLQKAREEAFKVLEVSNASRLLPDVLMPSFALFQMCAKIADLFGWGRRKRKTKLCAAAVADLSLAIASIVAGVKSSVESLPMEKPHLGAEPAKLLKELLGPNFLVEVCDLVLESQKLTRCRIEPFLDYVMDLLTPYSAEE